MKKPTFIPQKLSIQGVRVGASLTCPDYQKLRERAKIAGIKESDFVRQSVVFALEHMARE